MKSLPSHSTSTFRICSKKFQNKIEVFVRIKLVIFPINESGWYARMGEFLESDGDNKERELE